MSELTHSVRRLPRLIAAGIVIVGGIAIGIWMWSQRDEPQSRPAAAATPPIPPFSETRFSNTGPDALYIGIDACAECHREKHKSYLLTAHSKALSAVDPSTEPPDASFHHQASGRDYRVYRQGGKLRHDELLKDADGREVGHIDLPVKYLIGSGQFGRSYLVEVDGFIHESPITWFASKKKWDMSPGYDAPQHLGFERPVPIGCLNCHSGRAELTGGTAHKITVHEQAIGCERCHGPGSLHAAKQRSHEPAKGDEDLTIVNPARMSRSLVEAICSDCHLNSAASIVVRGRGPTDFRPGRPLTDYRINYRFDSGTEDMTVVGHVEQLRRSACYQKSENLTCVTCHDPHQREQPKDLVAFHRQKCLNCHATNGCSLPVDVRQRKERDNCAACHMPRGDTDIPHVAFTHHRIDKHGAKPTVEPDRVPELVPTDDMSRFAPLEQQRNLALAYFQVSTLPEHQRYASTFRERAKTLLEEIRAGGIREGVGAQVLAQLYWDDESPAASGLAREAIESADLTGESRSAALKLLASHEFQARNYKGAIVALEEVVRLRRMADDWRLLGVSYMLDDRPQKALPAMQEALAIAPFRADVQGGLFEIYSRLGERQKADAHLKNARWLERNP